MLGRPSRLRATVGLGGLVATVAGVHTMAAGTRAFPGVADPAGPSVEGEARFFGAFYAAYGIALLRLAPRADRDAAALRAAAATLFAGGAARAGGWLAAGRPHPVQQGLLAVELLAPPVVVAWQARLAASR